MSAPSNRSRSLLSGLMGLEIIGTDSEVWVQVVCHSADAALVAQQLMAQFPGVKITWGMENLLSVWGRSENADEDAEAAERVVLDFGLWQEFMRPPETGSRVDPLVSLIGGMAHLSEGEAAVYQVLFTPLRAPWAENALAAVTKEKGKPFIDDGPELVKQAQAKVSRPLYGAVLRLAAKCPAQSGLRRAWEILRGLAPALRVFSREGGQSLMPLPNTDDDHEAHCGDLLWRRSRRCGMILNVDEVVALAHFPTAP